MFGKKAALVAATLGLSVNAHLFLSSPSPIPGSAPKSPLLADGSNFPCHGVSLPSTGGENMAAGSSQLLAFDLGGGLNTAVHGGGSCQISITYETDPVKVKDPKSWYVIYSIEGGCPTNTLMNLDGTYQGPQGSYSGALACSDPQTNGVDCVNQFNFTIPQGVKDGHATLAWTWYNSVGNRELYMNCVSVELSGGDGSGISRDEYPSMFVANMASVNKCPTTAYQAVKFPYPGKYVTTKTPSGDAASTASTYPLALQTGPDCASDGAPINGAAATPTGYSGSSPSSAAPTGSTGPSSAAGSNTGLVTITTMRTVTGGASKSAPAASSAPVVSSAPVASSGPVASSAAPFATGSSLGSCADGKVACSSPGQVICVGSDQFGICNIDYCAIPQPLAAGTECSNGVIAKRSHVKRVVRV